MDNISHSTEIEKKLLCKLKNHSIIESKRTDATLQNKLWELLTMDYNRRPEIVNTRSSGQLKTLRVNLKQKKVMENTLFKLTGGGPSPKQNEDPILQMVDKASNNFDSTAAFESENYIKNKLTENEITNDFVPLADVSKIEPILVNDDSNTSHEMPQEITNIRTNTNSSCKRCAVKKGLLHVKRIKTADKKLHQIRIEIANLERKICTSQLNKVKNDEKLSKIKLETATSEFNKAKYEEELAKMTLENYTK